MRTNEAATLGVKFERVNTVNNAGNREAWQNHVILF